MPTPPHPDDIRAALIEAGERLTEARRAEQDALLDIGRWLHAGQAAGMEKKEMAELAGISRTTGDKLLSNPPIEIGLRH